MLSLKAYSTGLIMTAIIMTAIMEIITDLIIVLIMTAENKPLRTTARRNKKAHADKEACARDVILSFSEFSQEKEAAVLLSAE